MCRTHDNIYHELHHHAHPDSDPVLKIAQAPMTYAVVITVCISDNNSKWLPNQWPTMLSSLAIFSCVSICLSIWWRHNQLLKQHDQHCSPHQLLVVWQAYKKWVHTHLLGITRAIRNNISVVRASGCLYGGGCVGRRQTILTSTASIYGCRITCTSSSSSPSSWRHYSLKLACRC